MQPLLIKLPFVIKIFGLPILGWPFYTGFTVHTLILRLAYFQIKRVKDADEVPMVCKYSIVID